MNAKDYEFHIGDKVITTDGVVGEIADICRCENCEKRGFYEPIWVRYGADRDYITKWEAEHGFPGFYAVGKYRFNNFDKSQILADIKKHELELKRLQGQLSDIEFYERADMHDPVDFLPKCNPHLHNLHKVDGTY